jgi:2-polyprenyl-6-methoxyphenol hydroxylase-like FAD-dependent oxidoreductase
MVPARGFERVKTRGLQALADEMVAIDERLRKPLGDLTDWQQVSYMECRSLYVVPWVMDGIVLIGDAAHACHPHIAQGSTQAMLDAVALAPVLSGCLKDNNCTAERLSAFERARRPTVEALQRIAHEYAWLWNSRNPLLAWVRDRIFREIGRQPHLLSKVMETEAGIRVAPLTAWERLQALGMW